jgi:hypothetical protein
MPGPGPGAGMTLEALRSRVKDQATFAETDTVIDGWIIEKELEAVVEAGWDRRIVQIALTVANTGDYVLDQNIADIHALYVDGLEYEGEDIEAMFALREGARYLTHGGVYSDFPASDGTPQLALYPIPDTAGLEVKALVTYTPVDLVAGGYPRIPRELQHYLADGAIAEGYRLRSENSQEAADHELRYQGMIEKLRKRRNTRHRGGPVQIGLRGTHF